MTSLAQAETRIIDICPPGWCWSRLAEAEEGILSYATPLGRVTLAVPYAVSNQQLAISIAPSNTTMWSPADGEATLEVIGVAAENQRWLVRATGTPQRAGRPNAPGSDWLILPPARLRGFYETSLQRAAAIAFSFGISAQNTQGVER